MPHSHRRPKMQHRGAVNTGTATHAGMRQRQFHTPVLPQLTSSATENTRDCSIPVRCTHVHTYTRTHTTANKQGHVRGRIRGCPLPDLHCGRLRCVRRQCHQFHPFWRVFRPHNPQTALKHRHAKMRHGPEARGGFTGRPSAAGTAAGDTVAKLKAEWAAATPAPAAAASAVIGWSIFDMGASRPFRRCASHRNPWKTPRKRGGKKDKVRSNPSQRVKVTFGLTSDPGDPFWALGFAAAVSACIRVI